MIYARAREAEIKYREGQGLPCLDIIKFMTEDGKLPLFMTDSIGKVAFSSSVSTTPRSDPGTDTRDTRPLPPATSNSSGGVAISNNASATPGSVPGTDTRTGIPPPPTTGSNLGFLDAQLAILNSVIQNAF